MRPYPQNDRKLLLFKNRFTKCDQISLLKDQTSISEGLCSACFFHGGINQRKNERIRNGKIIQARAIQNPSNPTIPNLKLVNPRKLFENNWPPITTFQRMKNTPKRTRQLARKYMGFRNFSFGRCILKNPSVSSGIIVPIRPWKIKRV